MHNTAKTTLSLQEKCIHDQLAPLGFKKHKLTWRRSSALIHQFALVSMQLGDRYQALWGVHVSSSDENPRPQPHRLHVQWFWTEAVSTPLERERFMQAFDPSSRMDSGKRVDYVSQALARHVLPCFDGLATDEDVRAMLRDSQHPRRAHQFYGLPQAWWPTQPYPG
jgi:hypothetical protein